MSTYPELTLRNIGYVAPPLQERIRDTRLLVAGCGIGSMFAEAAARLGFTRFLLADGDTVSRHNLNRQNFVAADVARSKVVALAERLRAINPEAEIEALDANLDPATIPGVVADSDIVFDTIDFLELPAIVALHDACRTQGKPAITALAIGWGAGCIYFPPGGDCSFRRAFGLGESESVEHLSYRSFFAPLVRRLADRLPPEVVDVVSGALAIMDDGTPCPASQVSPGSFSLAALATTLTMRILAGQSITPAPNLILMDLPGILTEPGIDLLR